MILAEIINYLETLAPSSLQESYDNAGLIVGNPSSAIHKALICLDSTEEIIDEAIEQKVDLIIAHHPIVFKGLKKLNGKNYVERVVMKAIQHNIAIYAIHTNLDNVMDGVNNKIAEKLGLRNCKILASKNDQLKKLVTFVPKAHADDVRKALFDAGCGIISNYDECSFNVEGVGTFRGNENTNPFVGEKNKIHHENEIRIETVFPLHLERKIIAALLSAHPYEEVAYDIYLLDNKHPQFGAGMVGELSEEMNEVDFLNLVKLQMKTDCIRHTALLGRGVRKVAVCGGSGSFLLNKAKQANADFFITADFKYHEFFDAENDIVIADVGHYESEQFTIDLLFEVLSKKYPTFALLKTKISTNPIKYFQ